eukprot:594817_1
MASLLKAFAFTTCFRYVTAQTKEMLCVWNSVDAWDEMNGEYVLQSRQSQSGLNNGSPYWKQSSTPSPSSYTCPQTVYYIFAAIWDVSDQSERGPWWHIYHDLQQWWVDPYPHCQILPFPTAFSSNPTVCTGKWYRYSSGYLSLAVTAGSCPALKCDALRVSNTGHQYCDGTFVAVDTNDNTFSSDNGGTQMYFFFNPYSFRWHCDDNLANDCGINENNVFGSMADSWTDISIGSSYTLSLSNGNEAILECLDITTQYPTILTSFPTPFSTYPPTLGTVSTQLVLTASLVVTSTPSRNPSTTQRREVVEPSESSISPTAMNIRTGDESDMLIAAIAIGAAVVVICIVSVLVMRVIKKEMAEEQAKTMSVEVNNTGKIADNEVKTQTSGKTKRPCNPHNVEAITMGSSQKLAQIIQMNAPKIKHVFDNDDDEVVDVPEEATVGRDLGVDMGDDEFEVIGDEPTCEGNDRRETHTATKYI